MTYYKYSHLRHYRRPIPITRRRQKFAERAVYHYGLTKLEHEKFGITIIGGIGSQFSGIYIKTISPFGVCGYDGRLCVGDLILELNGNSLVDVTHEEAYDIFSQCGRSIYLVVSRIVERKEIKEERMQMPPPYYRQIISGNNWDCMEEPEVLEVKTLIT